MSATRPASLALVGLVALVAALFLGSSVAVSADSEGTPTTIAASHLKGVKTDKVDWKA